MSTVSHIPAGLTAITPQLVLTDATKAAEFYQHAFGAELMHAMPNADGKGIMHGALRLGEGTLFISDAGFAKPTSANTFVYFKDVDAVYARAVKAGVTIVQPLTTMFWGDRWAMVSDPFGNTWQLAQHIEDVSPDEMKRRMAAGKPG